MKKNSIFLFALLTAALMSGCERPIIQETRVHEDGSLDKSISFERTDTAFVLEHNMFNVSKAKGWETSVELLPEKKDSDEDRYRVTFSKSFASAGDMNAELDTRSDTLFNVHSSFEKSFRWFYTYIRYSETYRPINRFERLPYTDFFNAEDFQFINRLPAEGARVSKADSASLQMLTIKVDEYYTRAATTHEQVEIFTQLLRATQTRLSILDSAEFLKEAIYLLLEDQRSDNRLAYRLADSLGIRFPDRDLALKIADSLSADFNARFSFMGDAREGRYRATIEMPWTVVNTNADSVAGNTLFWRPLKHKFLFTDYELYAESRQLNVVTTGISLVIIGIGLWAFVRRMRS